jgi:hypothetical protein
MRRYALDPSMPVLLRPDGAVQVGWDPRRAVLVRPPSGLSPTALAELLRTLQSGATLASLQARFGVDAGELVASLTRRSQTNAAPETTDLVVLSDFLVADPRVVRELHTARVAHLPVRLRDGAGLVGPLVIPGVTSCLGCADLHRSDRDAAWPAVASQLRNAVGSADRATVLATAALALNQIDRVIRAVRGGTAVGTSTEPPPTLDTTLEFDVNAGAIMARRWSRHPRCWC